MASKEQSVTLLRRNKRAQVEALNALGFSLTESVRASEFPNYVKWAAGLLDVCVAANRKADNKAFFFTADEWAMLSATEQALFVIRGVRLRAEAQSFIIAAVAITSKTWGSSSSASNMTSFSNLPHKLNNYYDAQAENTAALKYYNGITANGVEGCPAFEAARDYKAYLAADGGVDDQTTWLLPTVAQGKFFYRYKTQINEVLKLIGSSDNILNNAEHWTCCQWSSANAYCMNVGSGRFYDAAKTGAKYVRPIALE
jgi:hypothetical protein